jgi:hypothetical protein
MIKLYPSSSDFLKSNGQYAEYESKCLRHIIVTQKNPDLRKQSVSKLNQGVAEIDEARYRNVLASEFEHIDVELPFKLENVGGHESVVLPGRMDYVCYKDAEKTIKDLIVEKKSSISKNQKTKINKKEMSPSQLAQLVLYMVIHKVSKGRLVRTYYGFENDLLSLKVGSEVRFDVELDGNTILVDGKIYEDASVTDLMRFYKVLADGVALNRIPPRPLKTAKNNVCDKCPFAQACDELDNGLMNSSKWLHITRQILQTVTPKQFKQEITHYKRPMVQKLLGNHNYKIKELTNDK